MAAILSLPQCNKTWGLTQYKERCHLNSIAISIEETILSSQRDFLLVRQHLYIDLGPSCTHPPRADLIHHIQCTSRGQCGPLPHITVPTLPEQTSSTTFSVHPVASVASSHTSLYLPSQSRPHPPHSVYIPWPAWLPPTHHCTYPPRADLIHHIQCTSRGQRGSLPHITVPTLPEQTSSTTFSVHPVASVAPSHTSLYLPSQSRPHPPHSVYIPWPAWPPPTHHCTYPPRADLIHHIQCTSRGQRGPLPHITVPTLPEQTSSTTFSVHPVASVAPSYTSLYLPSQSRPHPPHSVYIPWPV